MDDGQMGVVEAWQALSRSPDVRVTVFTTSQRVFVDVVHTPTGTRVVSDGHESQVAACAQAWGMLTKLLNRP